MLEDLSQHILDISENSLNAGATEVSIILHNDLESGYTELEIIDNGKGMDKETALQAVDPFSTSRTTRRVGLGLPFLKQSAELCEGDFQLESKPGEGTKVKASFRIDSIDTPPPGDIPSSLVSLLVAHPDILWEYQQISGDLEFKFKSSEIVEILGDPEMLKLPDIATWLREYLRENIGSLNGN